MNILEEIDLKVESHKLVLNLIRQYKEISGAEIARITGYKRSSIFYILQSLQQKNLIEYSKQGKSTELGGKPPKLWQLVKNRGYFLGLEIIPGFVRAVILDFAGNILNKFIKKVSFNFTNDKSLKELTNLINSIFKDNNIPKDLVIGVGITIPGLVNSQKGVVTNSSALEINNLNLQSILQNTLSCPVYIANDANAGALGIKWFYPADLERPSHIVFLSINEAYTGIGAGLIFNDQLYEGATGTAGEVVPFLPTIETLIKQAHKIYPEVEYKISVTNEQIISIIGNMAQDGCPVSKYIIKQICKVISRNIVNIIELLNPELIVIGGDISCADFIVNEYIGPFVKELCNSHIPDISLPTIKLSEHEIFSVAIGATALVLRNIFL